MEPNDFDVRTARERLGLTTEALAATLHVTEGEVRAWEAGSLRVSGSVQRYLEYLVAHADWHEAMAASGLPGCEWIDGHLTRLADSPGYDETMRLAREIESHGATCATCRARSEWAARHLPPPPQPPARGLARLPQMTERAIGRLPRWARPAAWGAVALSLMTGVRVLFMLPALLRTPLGLLQAIGAVLLASGAGAVGGLGYSLTRPLLVRLGTVGDYLSGIVGVMSYLGAFAVLTAFTADPMISDLPGVVIFLFVATLFGLIVGKFIHDAAAIHRARA
ncbi:MAG TPA: hypothetical protein VFS20_25240 [Longimicrobium sp.]|nr:hypothetical protein [Longimicrobium sp.]